MCQYSAEYGVGCSQSRSAGALDSQTLLNCSSSRLRSRAKDARRGWVSEPPALSLSVRSHIGKFGIDTAGARGAKAPPLLAGSLVALAPPGCAYFVERTSLEGLAHACVRLRALAWLRGNLVDPASSHMLVSKIKPCMSQYKLLYGETANGSLKQL